MADLPYGTVMQEFRGLQYMVPDPEEVEVRYRELGGSFPYWTKVWDAGLSLATWLAEEPGLVQDKVVLELGAGIGLPSFIAARVATEVVVSDHDEAAVAWAEMNIRKLGLSNVRASSVNWKQNKLLPADVVIMSDVGYDPADFTYLEQLSRQYIDNGTKILMTVPARIVSSAFIGMLGQWVSQRRREEVNGKDVLRLILQ